MALIKKILVNNFFFFCRSLGPWRVKVDWFICLCRKLNESDRLSACWQSGLILSDWHICVGSEITFRTWSHLSKKSITFRMSDEWSIQNLSMGGRRLQGQNKGRFQIIFLKKFLEIYRQCSCMSYKVISFSLAWYNYLWLLRICPLSFAHYICYGAFFPCFYFKILPNLTDLYTKFSFK